MMGLALKRESNVVRKGRVNGSIHMQRERERKQSHVSCVREDRADFEKENKGKEQEKTRD